MILKLLNAILRGLNLAGQSPAVSTSALSRKIEALLATPESANLPLSKLAEAAGYQQDYLNRLLKNSIGLTIGQLRSRQRFLKAKRSLCQSESVTDVATALGFADPNYFARWFRKLSGKSPSEWRHSYNEVKNPTALEGFGHT
jgi:AraC-like DNA-binding protein